jgi:hypothetical protein
MQAMEISSVKRIWTALAIAVLIGIAPLMAFPNAVGAEPNPNKPIVFPVDDTFLAPMATNRCGVDIWVHVFGTFTVKVLPNGVEHWRIRYDHVFSGPSGSVSVNHIENVKFTAITMPDGTLVDTVSATGQLLYHDVVPGLGSFNNNSGREVLRITWQYDEELGEYVEVDFQVLFEAGPDNNFDDAFWALFCAQLV